MKWKKERDLLIAQTMAFVQSVAVKTTEVAGRVEPIPLDEPDKVERPVETTAIMPPSPVRHSELREEIRGRVAAFRARQALFNRNRDEYCDFILAKVRASTEHPPTAPGNQPANIDPDPGPQARKNRLHGAIFADFNRLARCRQQARPIRGATS